MFLNNSTDILHIRSCVCYGLIDLISIDRCVAEKYILTSSSGLKVKYIHEGKPNYF